MSTGEVTESGPSDDGESPIDQHRKAADRAWLITNVLLVLGLGILIVVVPAIAIPLHRSAMRDASRDTDATTSQLNHDSDSPPNDSLSTPDVADTNPSILNSDFSELNDELSQCSLQLKFATAQQAINRLEEAEHAWSELVERTYVDAVGRCIAADETLLLRFIALQEFREQSGPEHTTTEAQDGFNQLRQLTPKEPSEFVSLASVVDALGQKTFDAAVFHRASANSLEQMRGRASTLPPGDLTLAAQLRTDQESSKTRNSEAAEAAAGDVKHELKQQLAVLHDELKAARKTVDDLNSDLAIVQRGEGPAKRESAEREPIASRKDYVRESPAIRSLLKPFTTPGYAQPESADKMIHGSAKQPVSYSTLKRIGALEEKGLSVLFRVGGTKSTSQQNDRPLGSFPRMYSLKELEKPDVRSQVVEAQRLLRQYGPFLIEDGLLAP